MKYLLLICVLSLIIPSSKAIAEENAEIEHLLNFVEESGCMFIRNGTEHSGPEAKSHLEYKYETVKSRIKSAELFIDRIASKSIITRKRYKVRCTDGVFFSGDWLHNELLHYRAKENRE